jgi:hypothetical protein
MLYQSIRDGGKGNVTIGDSIALSIEPLLTWLESFMDAFSRA